MSMEGFSASQIAHIGATTLDLYMRGKLKQIGVQNKPLLKKIEAAKKSFSGAKENISIGVKFERGANGVNDGVKGYSHTDKVSFYNPGKGLRANYVWREHHIGFTMSETELKTQGILVGNEFGNIKRSAGDKGLIKLADIFEEAVADFDLRYEETMNALLWDDGTADTSSLHGLRAFIRDVPTIGVVGGLSAATHTRWRNRARTAAFSGHGSFDANYGGGAVTSSTSDGGALVNVLQQEWRQLMRYGGQPNTILAGSDFIEAYEIEMRANGNYSMTGWTGKQDAAMGQTAFKGVPMQYDPTLDSMGRDKYAYIFDDRHIYLKALEGDWKRMRDPARPYDQFVMHKSLTATGQLCAEQRDSALVIAIS